ncbi:MAG: hypothetical protein HKN37_03615 [Rhodothermales bacterium]|nr:hypothetical protein [Rhodothermales bacterium]
MSPRLLIALLFSVPTGPSLAQTPGSCPVGVDWEHRPAYAELDVANVRARVHSNGALFWIGGAPVYEVPRGSGKNAIFASSVWIGGMVDGELRMSAATYSDWEMWPGPLNDEGNPPSDCRQHDRVFNVYDEDIRRYNETGEATPDMLDWPWELGAPVFDGDGNPDNYDLAAGDRPYRWQERRRTTGSWTFPEPGHLRRQPSF